MAKSLKLNEKVTGKITSALSRGKAFILFIDDYVEPVIYAKRNAMDDGYVHHSQLVNQTITATPTQVSNGGQPGFLATVELGFAPMSTNPLLQNRQRVADQYALAALFAQPAIAEMP